MGPTDGDKRSSPGDESNSVAACQMLLVTSVMGDKTVCVGGGSLCRLVR